MSKLNKKKILKNIINVSLQACGYKQSLISLKDKPYMSLYNNIRQTLDKSLSFASHMYSKNDIKQEIFLLYLLGNLAFKKRKHKISYKRYMITYIRNQLCLWLASQKEELMQDKLVLVSNQESKHLVFKDIIGNNFSFLELLTHHEKLLAFLYCVSHKSITEISILTMQNRNTITRQLKTIQEKIRKEINVIH